MRTPAFTPEQDQQIAAEYEAGATFNELGARYGRSGVAIRRAVLRAGGQGRDRSAARSSRLAQGDTELQAEALRLYREGWSVKKLATRYGCRNTVISDLLRESGERLHPGGKQHPRFRTEQECRQVAEEYAAGVSMEELARRFECTRPTIANAIRRVGDAPRRVGTPKTWTPENIAWAAAEYGKGASQQSIAAALGISQTAVSRRLTQLGIQPSRPRARGDAHGSWRGGRTEAPGGYVYVMGTEDDLEFCTPTSGGYMLEHRLVMGRALGRKLTSHETVHHINGDHADNRLENLQLRQGRHGKGVVMTCNSCGSHDVQATEIAT